jgi:hypothetical protein
MSNKIRKVPPYNKDGYGIRDEDINDKLARLLFYYKHNPIEAIEALFSVSLDDQQRDLVRCATKQHSRVACKSSQGSGKTFTLVCLSMYFLLVEDDCRILMTAPSSQLLSRVFHSEFQKLHARLPKMFQGFFEVLKESIFIKGRPYQILNMVTGSPSNLTALQGGHSHSYHVFMDEANGISEEVFDTLLGTLGASHRTSFIMTANPVQNHGRFYEVFAKNNERWDQLTFNAYDSNQSTDTWIADMKAQYGEDSDNYKIRVLGEFGRFGENQFFDTEQIDAAIENRLSEASHAHYPIVCALDPARYGPDSTVFVTRQGPKLLDIREYKGLSTMEVAAKAVDYYHRWRPVSIMVDSIGLGAGIYDRMVELGLPAREVIVSNKPSNPKSYGNLRAQVYGEMREWLYNGADILDHPDLVSQLNATAYTYNNKMQIMLLTKKEIKRMGLPSPDIADAIALTFAPAVYGFLTATVKPRQMRRVQKRNWV